MKPPRVMLRRGPAASALWIDHYEHRTAGGGAGSRPSQPDHMERLVPVTKTREDLCLLAGRPAGSAESSPSIFKIVGAT